MTGGDEPAQARHDSELWPFPAHSTRRFRDFLKAEKRFRKKTAAIFDSSVVLEIAVPLEPTTARHYLPAFLRLDRRRPARFFVAEHPGAAFCERYIEVGLLVPVRGLLGAGQHIVWMVVDNDTALLVGRELLAVPKKMAELEFTHDVAPLRASVRRRGAEVVTVTASPIDEPGGSEPFYDQVTYCVGGMAQLPLCAPVWAWRATETIVDSRAMRASLCATTTPFDPIGALIARTEDLEARLFTVTCHRGRYLWPVGIAGPSWFGRTYDSRYR